MNFLTLHPRARQAAAVAAASGIILTGLAAIAPSAGASLPAGPGCTIVGRTAPSPGPLPFPAVTIFGTPGDDTICLLGLGGPGSFPVFALGGDDTVWGTPGADFIFAGSGDDFAAGGQGNDRIEGGSGNDDLFGEEGNDTIDGGAGADYISGGTDRDQLYGGKGVDVIHGDSEADYISGQDGADFLFGGEGSDTIHGGDGADMIMGDSEALWSAIPKATATPGGSGAPTTTIGGSARAASMPWTRFMATTATT